MDGGPVMACRRRRHRRASKTTCGGMPASGYIATTD